MNIHVSTPIVEAAGINPAKMEPEQVINLAQRILADTFVQHQRTKLLDRGLLPDVSGATVVRSMSPYARESLRARIRD